MVVNVDWPNLNVDEAWFGKTVNALTPELLDELCKLRGFHDPARLNGAINGGIGWHKDTKSWVLSLRNIMGDIHAAKLWRPTGGKWISAGVGSAMRRQKEGPIGRIFSLDWVISQVDATVDQRRWLWVTAGEWDCLMLRCFGWLVTTSINGETSKPQLNMLLREFGGNDACRLLLDQLAGIAVCFDVDGPGHVGMVQFVDAFEKLIDNVGSDIPVKSIDLRQIPGWHENGSPSGWDVSDLVKWARNAGVKVGSQLSGLAISGPSGVAAAREMFGVDETIGAGVTVDDLIKPDAAQIHMITMDDAINFGITYGRDHGNSRAQGAFHVGVVARKRGWLFEEFINLGGHIKYAEACLAAFGAKDHSFDADATYKQMARGFATSGSGNNNVTNEHANARRFAHSFSPFLKYIKEKRRWVYWDGSSWVNGDSKAYDQAMTIPDYIDEEAGRMFEDNPSLAKALYKWANRTRTRSATENILAVAAKSTMCELLPELGETWDSHGLLIGTPRGVFDLESGQLLVGADARDKFCSMSTRGSIMAGANGDAGGADAAGHAKWGDKWELGRKFWNGILAEWQQGPDSAAVIEMLKQMGGMCLRGQLDEKLIVFKGSGRSGKSTLLDGISTALGDYAYEAAGEVFVRNRGGTGTNMRSATMAQMNHKRMIKVTEVGGRTLDVDTIKQMTGETTFTGRLLYTDPGVTANHGTYFMMTNTELDLRGDMSEALRGRLIIVPFETSFVDADRLMEDEYRAYRSDSAGVGSEGSVVVGGRSAGGPVAERLDDVKARVLGRPGWEVMHDVILTWMYEGFLDLRANGWGLVLAPSVGGATHAMWASNDVLGTYWTESGIWARDGGSTVVWTAWLYENVMTWARMWDEELVERLTRGRGTGAQTLGELLRTASARGYEKMLTTKYLGTNGKQRNCWKVPYTYIGPPLVNTKTDH